MAEQSEQRYKIVHFYADTSEEAQRYISELPAQEYNEGDKAEVTYPDGSKHIYVLRRKWIDEDGKTI